MKTGSMDIRSLENESLLQLYISGELSDVDGSELEAQLRVDASLRAQLHDVRSLQNETDASLARLDQLDPIVPSAASQRFAMRRIRQQMTEIAARPKPAAKTRRISKTAWIGIAAAAAVVVFCLSILSSNVRDRLSPVVIPSSPDDVAKVDHSAAPLLPEESGRPWQVAVVSEDQSSQKIARLEMLVHDDLQDAWH